ncbi:hypothetical protein [Streptomyces longwoodensis]|uniref:hypothetical protein n=1 Tax=Streptomyces longwoodensis TaxID=68231 RepID=UPI00352F407B
MPQVVAPAGFARALGVGDAARQRSATTAVGVRELTAAAGLLGHPHPAWLWSRVGGDLMDLTMLARALKHHDGRGLGRTVAATALPPVVGELLPVVRADRPPRLPLCGFPLLTAPLFSPGGLAAAGEVGVPAGVADRAQQRLAVLAAEAPEGGPCRAVFAQLLKRGRHDRNAAVVGVVAALGMPVQLARQRRHRATLLGYARLWGYVQDATVGYGFRPVRAASWLFSLLLIGTLAYAAERPRALKPDEASPFNAFFYTLDLLLPIIDFGQEHALRDDHPRQTGGVGAAGVVVLLGGRRLHDGVVRLARPSPCAATTSCWPPRRAV